MYLQHFKLKELPYKIGPDPRFLFMTAQHEDALGKCMLTIQERGGIVAVYGDIGMGKSTIARRLTETVASDKCEVAMVLNPSLMTEAAFLKAIMSEFGVKTMRSYQDSLNVFEDFMLDSYENNKNLVLIIDEAQKLTPKMLGVLHALHNFESNTDKFMQMVLIGQNELKTNIEKLPNIKSRVVRFARLRNLNLDDTKELIAFRWHAASSGKSSHPFNDEALQAIFLASQGLPREINKLCHESLLIAFDMGFEEVTADMVKEAAADLLLQEGVEDE